MSVNLARTAEGWWVQAPAGMVRLDLPAASTGELLADRAALEATIQAALAAAPDHARPAESLSLLSPVTAPARVVAQMVNYHSHANDSGMDPDRLPPAFFRKTSHSITGPTGDRAMAVNHRPEAAAPQNPAPSDWRQAAITAFSESGLRQAR